MNNFHDHPDLTAYVFGELPAHEAAQVRQWIAASPEAQAEYHRILDTVTTLTQAPALPRRTLHPRQRETVLAMAADGSRADQVIPFARPDRPARRMSWQVLKVAAAAGLTVGAFVLGQKTGTSPTPASPGSAEPAFAEVNADPRPAPAGVVETVEEPAEIELQAAPGEVSPATVAETGNSEPPHQGQADKKDTGSPAALLVEASAEPGPPSLEARASVSLPSQPAVAPAAPAAPRRPAPAPAPAPSLKSFSDALASHESMVPLEPKLLRPAPIPEEFAGIRLSSPMPVTARPAPVQPRKPDPQPALVIHSWKAEIASCPWDSSRRLMRFVAQIPVEQPGIEVNEAQYKLVAKFDHFQVQGYRLVAEKHMPPSQGGTQATRFAWYEIIPGRNFNASADRPVTLGTIELVQPRNANAPALAPLKIVDRGQSWTEAREDFGFETAMIGFSLLLQGTDNIGSLNHKLVLDLAEKARGEDPKGERAKFIQAVRQAQRAAGL